MTSPLRLVHGLLRWPLGSQEQSRRNAMVAATALAERRRERVETEDFLRRHARLPAATGGAVAAARAETTDVTADVI